MKIVIEEMANGKFRVAKLTDRIEEGWFKSKTITDREFLNFKLISPSDGYYHWDSYAQQYETLQDAHTAVNQLKAYAEASKKYDEEYKLSQTIIKTHEVKL